MEKVRFKRIIYIMCMFFIALLLIFPATVSAKGSDDHNKKDVHYGNHVNTHEHQKMDNNGNQSKSKTKSNPHQAEKEHKTKSKEKSQHQIHPKKENKTPHKTSQQNSKDKSTKHQNNHPKQKTTHTEKKETTKDRSTQIHLHLNKCTRDVTQVYVKWNNIWIPMYSQGNSPLYKLKDKGQYVKDDITEFKLVTSTNEVITVPVSKLRVGVEAQGTINYWLENCGKPIEKEKTISAGEKYIKEIHKTTNGVKNNVKTHPEKAIKNTGNIGNYNGALPQTGESDPGIYYLLGFLIAAMGVFYLFKKKK